jgi:3',5'-cyclic AMP phosphodiesterase CpdA
MREVVSRREMIGAMVAGVGMSKPGVRASVPPTFAFLHLTDIHMQPDVGAPEGVRKAFALAQSLPDKPAFALIGGDIVMSADEEDRKHAETVYDLWEEASQHLKMPLHYAIGNHDVYAIRGEHAVSPNDPDFGKRWWHKRLGQSQRFSTFDYTGWRFVVLDTVQVAEGRWWGEIDAEQMQWLDDLLRKTDKKQPMVFLTHVPIMTIFGLYTRGTTEALKDSHIVRNGKEFVERIQ